MVITIYIVISFEVSSSITAHRLPKAGMYLVLEKKKKAFDV